MIMAVDVPKNRVRDHLNGGDIDDDDEDGPIVFKRGGRSAAKQSNVDSGVKKPLSSLNGNANGRSVNSQKGSSSSSKPSSVKSPIGSPNVSASSSKESPKLSPVANLKPPTASDNQHKQAPKQTALNTGRKDSVMKKETADDEDSDDDKPLSVRMKGNANGVNKDTPVKEENSDDDDDNKPISTSISNKPIVSSEKKSLVLKNQQNGSVSKDKQQKPSKLMLPTKRPIDKANSSQQSLAKKSKIEDKPAPVKAESKAEEEDGSDDDVPIAKRMKQSVTSASKSSSSNQRVNKVASRRVNKVASTSFRKTDKKKKQIKDSKYSESTAEQPGSTDGQKKWTTLVHNGVIFPPPYQPHGVKILYKGKPVDLTPAQEEVATMFAVMKDSDYMQKPKFLENFWDDWRKILGKNHVIQKLEDCDFTSIYDWYQREQEKKRQRSKEEKNASKEEKLKQEEKCMWAIVDGVKEKVGNFKVEPPALFRGRGEHPKMGKLKRRIRPSDITINIGEDAPIPECPIPGESWKEVKHDNTVTWLAFWNDPINTKEIKYVFLAASSSLKGQSDKEKYEKARKLKDYIEDIRVAYTKDFTNKDVMKQQIAVATYLIDKLALRAGNEKDDDEADTVGCCTLKVANVECVPPNKLKFDFLGKDSIRYKNTLEVELPVYKAIRQFQVGKKQTDDLFDMLDTFKLNAHLKELMPGLTAKVFRTYNASITLDGKLFEETEDGLDVAEKVAVYSKANKEVAIICNHQRAISKSHEAQMMKLTEKIEEVKETLKELKTDLERAKKGKPPLNGSDGKRKRNPSPEAIQKKIVSTNQKIDKMELAMKTKDDLKTVALGTSKVNYLDPRITVAWCKRHEVPIEKMFNKSLLAKFAWAMDVDPQFRF